MKSLAWFWWENVRISNSAFVCKASNIRNAMWSCGGRSAPQWTVLPRLKDLKTRKRYPQISRYIEKCLTRVSNRGIFWLLDLIDWWNGFQRHMFTSHFIKIPWICRRGRGCSHHQAGACCQASWGRNTVGLLWTLDFKRFNYLNIYGFKDLNISQKISKSTVSEDSFFLCCFNFCSVIHLENGAGPGDTNCVFT